MQQQANEQQQQEGGSGDGHVPDRTKLIVNYIPQFTSEEDLGRVFGELGELSGLKIMRNPVTGYSYGYGFVTYVREDDAARAIECLNGIPFKNKNLKVAYSRPPSHATKFSNLYISNLPKDFTEDDLSDMFGRYGEIIQKNLLKDKNTGMVRGVAFVRFSRGDEAQAAISELDGKRLENSVYPLSVRVAEDHGRQRSFGVPPQIFGGGGGGRPSAARNGWNGGGGGGGHHHHQPQRANVQPGYHQHQREPQHVAPGRYQGGGGDFDYVSGLFW